MINNIGSMRFFVLVMMLLTSRFTPMTSLIIRRHLSRKPKDAAQTYASLQSSALSHEQSAGVLKHEIDRLVASADKDKDDNKKKIERLEKQVLSHEKQVELNMAKAEETLIVDAFKHSSNDEDEDKKAEEEIQKLDSKLTNLGWRERLQFSRHHHEIAEKELKAMEEHEDSEYESSLKSHHHALGLVTCATYLILWTLVFDYGVKWINRYVRRSGMPELGEVVNVLTDDLAAFGFTTVILFILIRGGIPEKIGNTIMPNERDGEEFVEMLEFLDFSLFGMLIIYAIIIIILLLLAMGTTRKWRLYEKRCHRDQRQSLSYSREMKKKEEEKEKKKSDTKEDDTTTKTTTKQTNLDFALSLRKLAEQDEEFHDYLSCRTIFLCNVQKTVFRQSHKCGENVLEAHTDRLFDFSMYMQRSIGVLLAPPPKVFVVEECEELENEKLEDDEGGLVQLNFYTWFKLLCTLLLAALIMSLGDTALQLGSFVALSWICVIFVSVIYFDSRYVHECLVPKTLRLVRGSEEKSRSGTSDDGNDNDDTKKSSRCPHCGLFDVHDDETPCVKKEKICWLLRADEPYRENKKDGRTNHLHQVGKFKPRSNGYCGFGGLDLLRYLLLVVCLTLSSGICVVWWWAFDNTGEEEFKSLGGAEVIVAMIFCFLATIIFVKILSLVLYHYVYAAFVPKEHIRRDIVNSVMRTLKHRAVTDAVQVVYLASLIEQPTSTTKSRRRTLSMNVDLTIDLEFEKRVKRVYMECGSEKDASGYLDVDGFLKACTIMKEHVPSLNTIRTSTLRNLYNIAMRHYSEGTPMALPQFRGAVDHLLKPGHEHAKDLYEIIVQKIRTRRSSIDDAIGRVDLDEGVLMDTKTQFLELLSRPELDGVVINDAALSEVYLLLMTYGARLSMISNIEEKRAKEHHASILTGLSAIWREHMHC